MPLLAQLTPPAIQAVYRTARQFWWRLRFALTGRVAWQPGYSLYKMKVISSALDDPTLLDTIANRRHLPSAFGVGIDERCVELPWLFSQLPAGMSLVLDAGSALNHRLLLERAPLVRARLHILTLAPEGDAYWRDGVSYTFGDLRDLPYRAEFFDVVACISTLEHIGCDASVFTGCSDHREHAPDTYLTAARELVRVLKPGGRMLLTVPYGERMWLGHSRQFDQALWAELRALLSAAGSTQSWFFRYSPNGWQASKESACQGVRYETHPERSPDRAAAARAVACVRLDKDRE